MCLIAWDWEPGACASLTLAANRDEFYNRPTQELHWWDGDAVLAGRDLIGGGTWLGVTRSGRMAALTNFRDPQNFRADASSRGKLVADYLLGTHTAADYLHAVLPSVQNYNAFNLLVWDGTVLMGLESRHQHCFELAPGIGAVSNADFQTPWPKVERLRSGMAQSHELALPAKEQALWTLLADEHIAPDEQLPKTGIALERERLLSPAFIRTPGYGTRASTLVHIDCAGLWMKERRFDEQGLTGTSAFTG